MIVKLYACILVWTGLIIGTPWTSAGLGLAMAQTSGSSEISDLKLMVQTLQQKVSAMHNTLLTQQTMSVDQVCNMMGGSKNVGTTPAPLAIDCLELQEQGNTASGEYTIQPHDETAPIDVFCDMATDGGGWTLIQRRIDGSEDFYRPYAEYETGFGNLSSEHWIGNKHIHTLTKQGKNELLVELLDYKQNYKYARYANFSVDDATSKYTLHVDGYNGTAGDSLKFDHDGHQFSATDNDNDAVANINCAEKHHGGYWYSSCFKSNINGKYGVAGEQGIVWGSFKDWTMYVLKRTEMKIRRKK